MWKARDYAQPTKSKKDKEFDEVFNQLQKDTKVVIPTDNDDNFVTIESKDYIKWVENQLASTAKGVKRSYIMGLHKDAMKFLEIIEFFFSDKEKEYIEETLFLEAIPQLQLLVKDHKKPDENGDFLTRMVIPATKFTASFSKLGYMGIKKVLDNHGVNYSKHTIVQIMSLDTVNMYPLVRVKLIRKALNHYAKDFPEESTNTINQCMDIIQFGMKSTLIQFRGKYYVYHRAVKEEEVADKDIVLAIGA
eukprot:11327651-Ditylum_brightwellii.AAC.1